MERRRFAAKWIIKQGVTDLPKYRRAADAPSVVGFAKVSEWDEVLGDEKIQDKLGFFGSG